MDIKATQLNNAQKAATVAQTTTTQIAEKTVDGKSFLDEMIKMPDVVENKVVQQENNVQTQKHQNVKNAKDFEFISTLNKEAIQDKKILENQRIHKIAEKELEHEIVLMNNQQVAHKKGTNNLKEAQISFAQKADEQIEEEREEKEVHHKFSNFEHQTKNKEQHKADATEQDFDSVTLEEDNTVTNETNPKPINVVSETASVLVNRPESKELISQGTIKENVTGMAANLTENNSEEATNIEVAGMLANADMPEKFSKSDILEQSNINTVKDFDIIEEENSSAASINKNDNNTNLKQDSHINSEKSLSLPNDKKINLSKTEKLPIIGNDELEIPQGKIEKTGEVQAVNPALKQIEEDIKVYKVEPIFKQVEILDNTLNTNKTTDIVKFIDSNLKTANSTKTSAASATKKSSSSDEKTIKMTEADAKFFNNLVQNNQQVTQGEQKAETQQMILKDVEEAKSAEVSKTLLNALKESMETNKSFRVDFDKDLSVVLRVNKNGVISAEFLPGDAAVEQYLKSNIPLLKQKFTDEGLEYENLSYRQQKEDAEEGRNKKNNRNGNNKENGYE